MSLNDLKDRIRTAGWKQWTKAAIWGLLYVLFIAWVGNWWWILLLPVVLDIFLTHLIPWNWWRSLKNRTAYVIMSWVDAILFALVAVYFINQFLFQNYQIPSSSLEKTLRVGDFLLVDKTVYGPRIPETPLSMPLMQNTWPEWFPLLGGHKSYLEHPHWDYRRMKGRHAVRREDIVVFNFPAGDTVCTRLQNPDYYTLCYLYGRETVQSGRCPMGELGDIIYRPTDRRECYVKRCVGVPGDRLQIIHNQVYVNGKILKDHPEVQYNYLVQTNGQPLSGKVLDQLGVSREDYQESQLMVQGNNGFAAFLDSIGLDPLMPIQDLPLTRAMKEKLEQNPNVAKIIIEPELFGGEVYPLGHNHWTRDTYGPVYCPKAGETIKLTPDNYYIYEHVIRNYEHQEPAMRDGHIYINGKETDRYTFRQGYYWMMGDNRHKSADSRYWGFVPEDHIIGQPLFIWLSLDKDHGGIRWNRFGMSAKQ